MCRGYLLPRATFLICHEHTKYHRSSQWRARPLLHSPAPTAWQQVVQPRVTVQLAAPLQWGSPWVLDLSPESSGNPLPAAGQLLGGEGKAPGFHLCSPWIQYSRGKVGYHCEDTFCWKEPNTNICSPGKKPPLALPGRAVTTRRAAGLCREAAENCPNVSENKPPGF